MVLLRLFFAAFLTCQTLGCGEFLRSKPKPVLIPASVFDAVAPQDAQALWEQAEIDRKAGDIDSAVSTYETIVQQYSTNAIAANALYRLGIISFEQGKPGKALAYFDRVLNEYPQWQGNAAVRVDKLKALRAGGDNREALKQGLALWKTSGEHPEIQLSLSLLLANAYKDAGNMSGAFEWLGIAFERVETQQQRDSLTRDTLGILEHLDRPTVEGLLTKGPSELIVPFLQFRLAQIEMEAGKWERARQHLARLLNQSAAHPVAPEIEALLSELPPSSVTAQPGTQTDESSPGTSPSQVLGVQPVTQEAARAELPGPQTAPPTSISPLAMAPGLPSQTAGSARFAVIIGISTYEDSRIPSLRYAAKDARAVYEWAVSPEGGRYSPSRVKLLLNEEATGKNIKDALFVWLKQALEEDIVVIYFAGHGSPDSPASPNNLFLLPYDTQYESIATTGFPMWDIETALKRFIVARKVVVIADACHAGGVGQGFQADLRSLRGIEEVNPISSGLQSLSKTGDGICVISASDDSQFSQESEAWGGGHGVFTYFLLEGLKGSADYNQDTMVTLGELIPFLSEQVRRETGNAQSPTVAGKFDPALCIGAGER